MSPMYEFFRLLWKMDRITCDRLANAVTKGYITEDEKAGILAS